MVDSKKKNLLTNLDGATALAFCTLVESGSFTVAATALGKAKSQLSREFSRLEKRVGMMLLRRTSRGLSLTPEGQLCYETSQALLEVLNDGDERVQRLHQGKGMKIRVAAPLFYGYIFIGPLVLEFMRGLKNVQVETTLANRQINLLTDGFDVVFQFGPLPATTDLTAQSLCKVAYRYFATPAYLNKHGKPAKPAELAKHECVLFPRKNFEADWRFHNAGRAMTTQPSGSLIVNTLPMAKDACLADLGIARLPEFYCIDEIKSGKLVSVLDNWTLPGRDFYVIYAGRQALPPVKEFVSLCRKRLHALKSLT